MALDHFVSQVHLRKFYSPALGNLMYAIRKSDLKAFRCDSRSVCRIEDGSTNAYLINDRAVEDFLGGVEPRYNASLAKLRAREIDHEAIGAIAGFAAYVSSCSPAAMRIHSGPLRSTLESTAAILDRQGLLPKAPPSLGGKTLTELLENKTVSFSVDPKYPQALGIDTITGRQSLWGNSHWDILINENADCPFFTSDFPVAIEAIGPGRLNWILPLAPTLAIRIVPNIELGGAPPDFSFAKFTSSHCAIHRSEAIRLNRLLVRCAEDLVFYRDDLPWVTPFVGKNCFYHVEAVTKRVPVETGFLNISTHRIVAWQPAKPPREYAARRSKNI